MEELFDDPEQDVCKVVQTALRVQDRRAKYLGLDAPVQVAATVHEVDAADVALQELLAEAHADNEARIAVLRRGDDVPD